MFLILYFFINVLLMLTIIYLKPEFRDATKKNKKLSIGIILMPFVGIPYVLLLSIVGFACGTLLSLAGMIAYIRMVLDDG